MAVILTGTEYIDLDAHGAALNIPERPLAVYIEIQTTATGIRLPFAHGRGTVAGRQEYCIFMGISTNGRITGRWENGDNVICGVDHAGGYNDGDVHRICFITRSSVNTNALRLFIDNSLVGVGSTPDSDLDTRIINNITRIGMDPDTAGREWVGQIANLAIWDVELTDQNGLDLTNGTIDPSDLPTGLLGYWPLDYNARDISGNDLHGTPVNVPDFTEEPPSGFDDFNRANEALDDGPWTLVDWSGTSAGIFDVVSNQCVIQSTNRSGAIHDTVLSTDDHYVEAVVLDHHVGVFARSDATGQNGYLANAWGTSGAGGGTELWKIVSGTPEFVDSINGVDIGEKVFIQVEGDQITFGQVGGTTKTIEDSSITTGKRVGIGASGNQGTLDDWAAQDVVGGGGTNYQRSAGTMTFGLSLDEPSRSAGFGRSAEALQFGLSLDAPSRSSSLVRSAAPLAFNLAFGTVHHGGIVFEPELLGTGSLSDRIFASLTDQGFTEGSLADRERARLLAKLDALEISVGNALSLHDLYVLADEPFRIHGMYGEAFA